MKYLDDTQDGDTAAGKWHARGEEWLTVELWRPDYTLLVWISANGHDLPGLTKKARDFTYGRIPSARLSRELADFIRSEVNP